MFKRHIILIFLLLLTFTTVLANPVSESEALRLATDFHQLRSPSKLRTTDALKLVWQANGSGLRSATAPAFYIYNIGEKEGFVIVSGEDATKTILGYADEGTFKTENMPENLRYWLNFYQQEIEAVRDASAAKATSTEVSVVASGTTIVSPLLGGIKWNQSNPYNLLCPLDTASKTHALAGCVAVAMAQIMSYYRWPATGSGTHTYIDPKYGSQSVDFSKTTYDWDNMLGSYVNGSSGKQDSAVATLIYHCGVAVNMKYNITGSSSNIVYAAEALVNHFGFDNEIQQFDRLYFTNDEWNALIKKELNNARPVNFFANSEAGGHSFVCDGYDSNNFFHINWGWGGSSNGYFELSSLSSSNPGVTGANPEFCYSQSILAGIHKDDGINRQSNEIVVAKTGLSSTTTSVNNISTSSFTLTFNIGNMGTNTAYIRWGIGWVKNGSTVLTKLVENSTSYTTFGAGASYSTPRSLTVSNPTALGTAGTYRLYTIYSPKDSGTVANPKWSIMRGSTQFNNCMIVTVAANKSATIVPALSSPKLVLNKVVEPLNRLFQNRTTNVDVTIQNNGQEFFSRVGLSLVNATDPGDRTYICESKVNCPAGETRTFHLSGTVTAVPGNYYLEAQYDSTNSNSTMNYKTFGPSNLNNQLLVVEPTPGPAALRLDSLITMPDGVVVSPTDTINLTASITNNGGYFDSRIIAFVFPKSGGHSLTYLSPKYVCIDSLQTRSVTLSGVPNLNPGDYTLSLFAYQDSSWNLFTPGSMASINFTVMNGSSSVLQTTESLSLHQEGQLLHIETSAEIQQSNLYDLSGRLLRTTSTEKIIPVGSLLPGVYLLQIQTNGKNRVERFLKH